WFQSDSVVHYSKLSYKCECDPCIILADLSCTSESQTTLADKKQSCKKNQPKKWFQFFKTSKNQEANNENITSATTELVSKKHCKCKNASKGICCNAVNNLDKTTSGENSKIRI